MNKKVIFIGGTGRSGSTLLGLILGNAENAMVLGEIKNLFYPTRKHHFEELRKARESKIWRAILDGGKKKLYSNLIKYFPSIDVFIDSSKDPFWQRYHKQNEEEYSVKNVLIYKSPAELANSYIKRGRKTQWIRFYVNYHRRYSSAIEDFVSISYSQLINDPKYLKKLCENLKVDYFEGKNKYWEKKHQLFFGSNTVKSENAHHKSKQLSSGERKNLKYDQIKNEYKDFILQKIEENPELLKIEALMAGKGVFESHQIVDLSPIKFDAIYLKLLSFKRSFRNYYGFFFPKNMFKKR